MIIPKNKQESEKINEFFKYSFHDIIDELIINLNKLNYRTFFYIIYPLNGKYDINDVKFQKQLNRICTDLSHCFDLKCSIFHQPVYHISKKQTIVTIKVESTDNV